MIKKKEFNGQYKFKLKDTIIKRDTIQPKKLVKKEIPSKLKVNLSSSLKYISKKKNFKRDKESNYNHKDEDLNKDDKSDFPPIQRRRRKS